jgi:hypothetical protein
LASIRTKFLDLYNSNNSEAWIIGELFFVFILV